MFQHQRRSNGSILVNSLLSYLPVYSNIHCKVQGSEDLGREWKNERRNPLKS